MKLLEFKVTDLPAIVSHAKSASIQQPTFYESEENITPKKGLFLVKDQGVYLMSNGTNPGEKTMSELGLVTYAKGCNPTTDEDWWSQGSYLCGGDDFCEFIELEWVQFAIDTGHNLIIELSDTEMMLRGDLMQER